MQVEISIILITKIQIGIMERLVPNTNKFICPLEAKIVSSIDFV